MALPPSRKDTFGPPKPGRNVTDLRNLVRHHESYLRSLDPGFLSGRFASPQLVRDDGTALVGGDGEGGGDEHSVIGEDGDRLVLTHLGTQVWRLSAEPVSETLVVRFHPGADAGVEWKRGEHYTIDEDDSVVTITAESLALARAQVDDVFSAQYLRADTDDPPGPVITSPQDEESTSDTTPTISGTSAGSRQIEVFVDGVSVGTTTASGDGTWSVTPASALAYGPHVVTATQINPDGGTAEAEPVDFVVLSPGPATATLRGGVSTGRNNTAGDITSLALPAGTQVGDLIVMRTSANAASALVVSDPRLTSVTDGTVWLGFATDLSDIQVSALGGFGKRWAIACITLATNAVGWTSAVHTADTDISNGETLPIGSVGGVAAAICGIEDTRGTSSGSIGTPVGYTTGIGSPSAQVHVRVDFWTNPTVTDSPATTALYDTGSHGTAQADVIGLIGP